MSDIEAQTKPEILHIRRTAIEEYKTGLREPSRPPSRGGNTRALHAHNVQIEGLWYSFLALGSQKWIYSSDTVSFDWSWDLSKKYRNIVRETIQVWDKSGNPVLRGNRGKKPKLRTAATRLPARRSDWKD